MTTEELLDELYDMVDKAWNLPLSGGRAVLDGEEVKQILDEIRDSLPQELADELATLKANLNK